METQGLNTNNLTGIYNNTSTTTINFYNPKQLIDTLLFEDRIELVYKAEKMVTTWPGDNYPKITKDIIKFVDGKMTVVETIEGKYLPPVPAQEESYEF